MANMKLQAFMKIAAALNEEGITPLLMGSVGLEVVTKRDWQADDLDIHVPGDAHGWAIDASENINDWEKIVNVMRRLNYELVDLHEHQFSNGQLSVGFGIIDTLPHFAGINLSEIALQQVGDVRFYLPNAQQYLKIYEASSKDSYRANKNNAKDDAKVQYLKQLET